jgi:tetratricopeptide (TPR) repeat protein
MLLVAEAYLGLKRYAESRELFERYLEKDPDNLAVIRRLVSTCYALNLLEDALHWCEHGLTLAAHDPELTAIFHELNREQATSSKFISRESEHFVVTFDRGEHADTRQQVLSILENAYRHVGGELGVYPERKIPVILYTQQAFFDVTRAPGWAGGLYDGKIRLPVGSMGDDSGELTRILTHEYVHAAIHQITDQCPRWINEGLAELFSQPEVPDIGQVIPLSRLERSFPSAPNAAVATAYAQSHAAVAYLIDRYSLSDLLNLLREMGEGTDFRTAFQNVYVIDLDQFIRAWGG